jgi:hypothetical protein
VKAEQLFDDVLRGLEAADELVAYKPRYLQLQVYMSCTGFALQGFGSRTAAGRDYHHFGFLRLTVTDGLLTSFAFHLRCQDAILLNIPAQIARWLLKLMNRDGLPDYKKNGIFFTNDKYVESGKHGHLNGKIGKWQLDFFRVARESNRNYWFKLQGLSIVTGSCPFRI